MSVRNKTDSARSDQVATSDADGATLRPEGDEIQRNSRRGEQAKRGLLEEAEGLGRVSTRDRLTNIATDGVTAIPVAGVFVSILAKQAVTPDWQKAVHRFAVDAARRIAELENRHPEAGHDGAESPVAAVPISLATVLGDWRNGVAVPDTVPLYLVVGGSRKYDPERGRLGLKEYQSTEPVTGVVRVARALSRVMSTRFVDAICDYSPILQTRERTLDLIVVGGGDTNRITKEFFSAGLEMLPARFEPATGSDAIVVSSVESTLSSPETGLVVALTYPKPWVRFALICAGNGASGTNAALDTLAGWLRIHRTSWPKTPGVVVQQHSDGNVVQVWPRELD
jgi:hypothetical protein